MQDFEKAYSTLYYMVLNSKSGDNVGKSNFVVRFTRYGINVRVVFINLPSVLVLLSFVIDDMYLKQTGERRQSGRLRV